MRLALPEWENRISPVLDAAGTLLVLDCENGRIQARRRVALEAETIRERARRIAGLGVSVLICGAVSRPLERALVRYGIRVIPQTCGEIDRVVPVYLAGEFHDRSFLMPGVCGRRRGLAGDAEVSGAPEGVEAPKAPEGEGSRVILHEENGRPPARADVEERERK